MLKFITKTIVFSCGVVLGIYALVAIVKTYQLDNLSLQVLVATQIEGLLQAAPGIEAVILGNSHSKAINFDTLERKGYYLWRGGQDIFEVQHKLWALHPYLPNLKIVFIPVSYFSFDIDHLAVPHLQNRRIILHTILPGIFTNDGIGTMLQGKLNKFLPVGRIMNYSAWRSFMKKAMVPTSPAAPIVTRWVQPDGNMVDQKYVDCNPWNFLNWWNTRVQSVFLAI